MKTRNCWHLPTLALLLAAGGCSRSDLVSATGTLTYKGQPVPSTWVIFQPDEEGKRASRGLTDDHGNFTLTNSRTDKGVLRGKHTVFLKYHVGAEEEMGTAPPKASRELKALIGGKYGDPKTSPLHYEVSKSGQHFEINLE
jgi:hypothetical protein